MTEMMCCTKYKRMLIATFYASCVLPHQHGSTSLASHIGIDENNLCMLIGLYMPLIKSNTITMFVLRVDVYCHAIADLGVKVYFIDMFDNDAETVAAMKAAGWAPVCYVR
jgi:hypothetical protein